MVNEYIPNPKDIVYLNFDPIKEYEQKGIRPAIVISSKDFSKYTNMAIACPISSIVKEYPTHYELKKSKKIKGSVLCEHIRSIDYEARNLKFIEKCADEDYDNILDIINSFVE